MRFSLDSLLILDAISRNGSFAAAADELHRVPSALSYSVHKLEQDLGVKLFDRSGHRAVLTQAGDELLQEGRILLRSAEELEARVKRVATGFETELRIAVSDLVPLPRLYPLLDAFYKEACGTRLRILTEVYGGCWDALASGRADLAIGAPGEGPAGGGYNSRSMGILEFVFAVAPFHSLASFPEPLKNTDIMKHRAVSAGDSSRNLPPRTSGLLSGQDVLTVPSMAAKIEAQCLGLGVGYLPRQIAEPEFAAGRLISKAVEEHKPEVQLFIAWRSNHKGKALLWFIEKLTQKFWLEKLLG